MMPEKFSNRTITGVIIPQNWDDSGNITSVSIQAFDEREYIVKTNKLGKKMFDFINQKVTVGGKVSERLDGKFTVEVDQLEVFESYNMS